MMKLYLNSSMVFYRIYDTGVEEFTMIFSKQGKFIHALNRDGTKFIKLFIEGATLTEAKNQLEINYRNYGSQIETFVNELVSKEILQHDEPRSSPIWIDPSDESTLLKKNASGFSGVFSRYISNIFHEGTVLVDSQENLLPHLVKFFPPLSVKSLSIDIGCGSGYYSDVLNQRKAVVVSTDISIARLNDFINRSRRNSNNPSPAVAANAESLPFKDRRFDLILCLFVLEHVMDINQVIKEMSRIARPGARLIISFPSLSLRETIRFLLGKRKTILSFEHLHTFGFLSSRVPWCRSMNRFLKNLVAENIEIEHMEGISLFPNDSENIFIKGILGIVDKTIGKIFPFNRFGEQTIIIGRKK